MTVPAPLVGDWGTAAWADAVAGAVPASVWSSYTPAWTAVTTAPALGNGTLAGYYIKVSDGYLVRIRLVAGSTTTYGSGAWFFSTPFARNTADVFDGAFTGIANGGTTNRYLLVSQDSTTTTFSLIASGAPTAGVSSTVPFTWASGNTLAIRGFYEGV